MKVKWEGLLQRLHSKYYIREYFVLSRNIPNVRVLTQWLHTGWITKINSIHPDLWPMVRAGGTSVLSLNKLFSNPRSPTITHLGSDKLLTISLTGLFLCYLIDIIFFLPSEIAEDSGKRGIWRGRNVKRLLRLLLTGCEFTSELH